MKIQALITTCVDTSVHSGLLLMHEQEGSWGACAACQNGSLDTGAAHATCCAVGEATRGHNAVTTLVHAAAQSCDCTAEMEVPGLIPGTDLRPADVLTSALGNSYTAHDASRSALRTLSRLVLIARRPDTRPNSHITAHTFPPSSARTSPTRRSCGVPVGDLIETR